MSYSANWGLILSSLAFLYFIINSCEIRFIVSFCYQLVFKLQSPALCLLCSCQCGQSSFNPLQERDLRISICDKYFLNTSVSFKKKHISSLPMLWLEFPSGQFVVCVL